MRTRYVHLGEMREAIPDDGDNEMSHISDMPDQPHPSLTTQAKRSVVLIALRA